VIDFEAIAQQIFDAAVGALGEGALIVEGRAKARARVRNLFGIEDEDVPNKYIGDIEALREARGGEIGRDERMVIGKAPTPLRAGGFRSNQRRNWRYRRLAMAERRLIDYQAGIDDAPTLDRRGASEVKTKRALFVGSTKVGKGIGSSIGGRLRGEIYAKAPSVSGLQAESWVISPTPYAKYMEFGTRHNRAFPFLRPAADESREEVVSRIAAAVREASRMNASSTDIEIVVRL
jgi:HK97 gp10 family phage protein